MTLRRLMLFAAAVLIGAVGMVLWERYGPQSEAPALETGSVLVDHIRIDKSDRRLTAFTNGQAVLSFDIALGFGPVGTKELEGDGKTPEGLFKIDRRNSGSAYHLSLGIDYPQAGDIKRAQDAGTNPGGDIFIHGQPNGIGRFLTLSGDWTAGCIAVSNKEIEALWRITPLGTLVEIRP